MAAIGGVDGRRELDVQLGGLVDSHRGITKREVQYVTSEQSSIAREMQVKADDLDPGQRVREAESDHRPRYVMEISPVLVSDRLRQRRIRRDLLWHRSDPDHLKASVDPDRGRNAWSVDV